MNCQTTLSRPPLSGSKRLGKLIGPGHLRANESGNALMLSMLLVVYFAVLVGSSVSVTQTVANNANRSSSYMQALAIAEGHSEYAFGIWRERVRDQIADIATGEAPATAELTWNDLKDITPPAGGLFPGITYTVDQFEVRPINPVLGDSGFEELSGNEMPAYAVGQFGNASSVFYLAKTDITMPSRTGDISVSLRRVFEKERENPALYAIFFDDDCEMHPGPSQIIDGWVHTNASLYTAHASLEFKERVTYSDDWLLDYHPLDTDHRGTPSSPLWASTPKNGAARDLFGYDPYRVFDKYDENPSNDDGNPNNDSYIEMIQKPVAGYDDPLAGERFYNKADLVIEVVTPNPVSAPDGFLVKDKSGTTLSQLRTVTKTRTVLAEVPVYEEQPVYEERPVYEEQPVYEERPIYEEQPTYEERPIYETRPVYEERPVYETRPVYQVQRLWVAAYETYVDSNGVTRKNGSKAGYKNVLVQVGTEQVQVGTEQVQVGTEQVQVGTEQVQVGTAPVQVGTEQVQVGTQQVQVGTEQVQVGSQLVEVGREMRNVEQEYTEEIVDPVYAAVRDSLSTTTMRDNRVGADVKVTNLDISKLNTLVNDTKAMPDWGGVIWISDVEANPATGDHRAIRLQNGGVLPNRTLNTGDERDGDMIGLTLVSQNPVYIQGDFNTGSQGSTRPVSSGNTTNFADFRDKYMVSGYEFRPAAIIADAVNILSNAWNDANADKSLSNRKASNTTVNAAIVSGNVPTGQYDAYGQYVTYSGGVENFPRFLEDWSGKYFTYHGSMIQLYRSEQAFYRWGKSNVYSAPNRRWFYEKNFVYNPPPSFPFTYKMSKHVWFQQ